MITSFRCYVTLIVPAALAVLTLETARAGGEPNQNAPEKLPLSIESVTGTAVPRLQTSIRWKDHEYDVNSGIDLVMGVVRDGQESRKERELALIQLAMLRTQLKGRPCLDELEKVYNNAGELEKQLILTCFLGSRDPRAIPVFIRTLANEQSMKLRLPAASGLAGWNVRRGVAELVDLLESKEMLTQPARIPYVRDNALHHFRKSNARKDWGFPENQWWNSIDARTNLDEDQKRALYIAERQKEIKQIKKWFAENEHRFPDWKAGDPLPEATPANTDKPAGE